MDSNEELWVDPQGNLVHVGNIRDTDKMESELVVEMIAKAKKMQEAQRQFKEELIGDIDAFISICRETYKVNPLARAKKGNFKLRSFDGKLSVQVTNPTRLEMDHKVMMAKEKIDQLLMDELNSASSFLRGLVTDAFKVNSEGSLNVRDILKLKKHECDKPLWNEAMKIIDDSIRLTASKTMVRFYEKDAINKDRQIDMDFSRLGVK